MSLVFAIEPLEPIWDAIEDMATEQWEESDYNIHGLPLKLDRDRYLRFNELGIFLMFTARDEGLLVGYAGLYLMPSMHTQTPLVTEDTIFLLPAYRGPRAVIRFYRFIEQEYIRIVGFAYPRATMMELSFTTKLTNGMGRVLEYLDFSRSAMQYLKQIPLTPVSADSGESLNQEAPADVRTITASRS